MRAGVEMFGCHKVTLEHDRASEAIGEIVITDRRDGNVELNRIDAVAENAGGNAAVEDLRSPSGRICRRQHG